MIDLNELRENPEKYEDACRAKGSSFSVRDFLTLDEQYRRAKTELEELRAGQNRFNKELKNFKGVEREAKLAQMKTIADSAKEKEAVFKPLEQEWLNKQLLIPNPPLETVPLGRDDTENVVLRHEGKIAEKSFPIRDHVELSHVHDLFDIERGVKIAGARSYFLKGDGMRLQHALMQMGLHLLHKKGYTLFDPPHIVRHEAMTGTGYFPGGEESAYHLDERDDDLHLIGTSEVSVCSYHTDEILKKAELPKRYAGYSPCYRREAGTYGKDTHGLYRVHQFYKVEQVIICENSVEESARMHAELLANSEELLRLLELPYRVSVVCTGDMGQGQVYKNDIEVWMPSRKTYGETHSCSSFYEFQARRLKMRYQTENGEKLFCHTLNNTLVASPRILIPLLENHQDAEGRIHIPKALQPFMGGQESIG